MHRCPELSKLPKVPKGRISSIDFRRQSPGSISSILIPGPHRPWVPAKILDPSHPFSRTSGRIPDFRSDLLGAKAVPFAVLDRPSISWTPPFDVPFVLWDERVRAAAGGLALPTPPRRRNSARLPMSVFCVVPKKDTSRDAHVRNSLVARLKHALTLVVVHGARADPVTQRLVLEPEDNDPASWLLPEWSYVFYPTLSWYREPYTVLVDAVRDALRVLRKQGTALEKTWAPIFETDVAAIRKVKQRHMGLAELRAQHTKVASPSPALTQRMHQPSPRLPAHTGTAVAPARFSFPARAPIINPARAPTLVPARAVAPSLATALASVALNRRAFDHPDTVASDGTDIFSLLRALEDDPDVMGASAPASGYEPASADHFDPFAEVKVVVPEGRATNIQSVADIKAKLFRDMKPVVPPVGPQKRPRG